MSQEKPKVEIPDPLLESLRLFQDQVTEVRRSFNVLITFVIGIMLIGFLVLIFTLVTIVFQAWEFRNVAERESKQLQVQEENIKNSVEQQKLILESLEQIKKELSGSAKR